MRIHLDTDLGGDPDDACALAMLLGWPGVELVGITTTIDPGGQRAGCVAHCLDLAGRDDIPVAAGAGVSLTTLRRADPRTDNERYWPSTLTARPSPPGAALDLLSHSIDQGATIIGIGPYTNLALLEVARPGSLGRVPVVVMGGWTQAPSAGLPAWGPERDFNVQWDTHAAEIVAAAAKLTLVALGWPGAAVEELRLRPVLDGKEVLQGLAVQPDSPLGEVSLRLRNPAGGQLAEAEPLAVHGVGAGHQLHGQADQQRLDVGSEPF